MSQDPKLKRLYEGDISGHESRSEAEMALATKLVFYNFNESEIEDILLSAGIGKAAEELKKGNAGYLKRSIKKAFEVQTERVRTPVAPDTTTPEVAVPELTLAEIAELQQNEFDLRLEVNLPEDHFMSMFTRWMQTISDGYTDYAVTCGLWTLSAIATEKTVLKLRQGHIRPNLWVVNLGRSTTSRKSTIINKTRQMFESATDTSLPNEDFSLEGYLETLSLNPVMHNVRDEMSGLMAKYHKKYNEGIYDLECVIYDCGGIQKTLASGKNKQPKTFSVKNPRVTRLYATTPDNFARYMSIDDFTCGYGVRFLFASPRYKHARKPLIVETDADIQLWGNVLVRIKKLWKYFDNIDGDVVFTATQEAMNYFGSLVS